MQQTTRNWLFILIASFLALALFALIVVGPVFIDLQRIPWILLVPMATIFALAHSWFALGLQRAALLFGCAVVVGFLFEYVGESQGWIFGPYCYTDLLGYKLAGRVPWLIPLSWYMTLYPSYLIANLLATGSPVAAKGRSNKVVLIVAILGAGVMTAWDLTMDPIMSYEPSEGTTAETNTGFTALATVGHPAWRWTTEVVSAGEACTAAVRLPDSDPKTYFGIPWRNFAGWMVTCLVALLIYGVIERRLDAPTRELSSNPKFVPDRLQGWVKPKFIERAYWLMPLAFFFALAIIDSFLGAEALEDVHLVSPFMMGIPAVAAALLLFHGHDADRRDGFLRHPKE